MNIDITKQTHTITINPTDLITNNTCVIFHDNYMYFFEKEPFVEYNVEDLETLKFAGKIKHKIGIVCLK